MSEQGSCINSQQEAQALLGMFCVYKSFKQMLFYFFQVLALLEARCKWAYQFDLCDCDVLFNKYLNVMEPVI